MNKRWAVIILISLLSSYHYCQGQQKFSLEISMPNKNLSKKTFIEFDNGRVISKSLSIPSNGKLSLSDSFYSIKAVIYLRIKDSINEYSNAYFVSNKPAKFIFQYIDTVTNKAIFKTINADELSEVGEKQYKAFTLKEERDISDFFRGNGEKMSKGDSNAIATSNQKILAVINKRLEFIKENRDLYYSFWVFRKNIIGNLLLNPDSLLNFYHTTFLPDFKKTEEGDQIISFLNGRLISSKNKTLAPEFSSFDLTGKKINLKNYRGKFIILNFWATWCVPCIAEIPALGQIRKETSSKKLEFIAISFDDDIEVMKTGIKKYKLDWNVNIHYDETIRKKYGVSSLPMLFLIDDKGRIIYNRKTDETQFTELVVLKKLIKELELE